MTTVYKERQWPTSAKPARRRPHTGDGLRVDEEGGDGAAQEGVRKGGGSAAEGPSWQQVLRGMCGARDGRMQFPRQQNRRTNPSEPTSALAKSFRSFSLSPLNSHCAVLCADKGESGCLGM